MGAMREGRCKAIRYGIRRARHDKRAIATVAEYLFDLKDSPERTFDHVAAVIACKVFPFVVGFVAPPIYTTAGRAWNREIGRRYVTPQLASAPTAQPDWWKHND